MIPGCKRWIVVFLVAAAGLWPALAHGKDVQPGIGRDGVYAIKWEERVIGYSRYNVENSVSLGGEGYYVINSDARIKLGAGESNDVSFKAKLLVNRSDLQPSFFFCRQTQGRAVSEVECLFSSHAVAQKTRNGREENAQSVATSGPAYLVFNNVWGRLDTFAEHYALLLSRWQAQGARTDMAIYDPVLRGNSSVHFQAQGREAVKLTPGTVAGRRFALLDARGEPIATAWIAVDSNRLLKLQEPGGFTMVLSDARVEELVRTTPGINLYKTRTQFSNVYFPDAERLRAFQAKLDVRLRGKPLVDRAVNGFTQKFNGDAGGGHVDGTVQVTTAVVDVRRSDAYPRRLPFSAALAAFVQPSPGVESGQDEMKSKAAEVAWRSRTAWEAVRKINAWVHDKVKEGYSMPSARYVLDNLVGNSESRSLLDVALMRSVGIPARRIDGILFRDGEFVPHHWVEAYVGDDGWVALDPGTGEEGALGASHIALSEDGEIMGMGVQVTSYAPVPPPRVSFFNRELSWPVGQERTYSVMHGGKEIGREVARVVGLTTANGHDAYQIHFDSDVQLADGRLQAQSDLQTDPNALPLSYQVTYEQKAAADKAGPKPPDSHAVARTFRFAEGLARETVRVAGQDRVQETPVSQGVYVTDPHFMSLWALVVGQLPNPQAGQSTTVHVYSPEGHSTQEITLHVRQEEKLAVNGEERDAWRVETSDGMSLFIDKQTAQVVRIEHPRQDLVLQLVESKTKI